MPVEYQVKKFNSVQSNEGIKSEKRRRRELRRCELSVMKKSTCRVEDLLIWQGRKPQVKIVPRLFHEEFETHSSLIGFYKQKRLEIKQDGGTENTRAMGINDRPSCSVPLQLSHRDKGDSQINPRSLQRVRVVPDHKTPTVGITS